MTRLPLAWALCAPLLFLAALEGPLCRSAYGQATGGDAAFEARVGGHTLSVSAPTRLIHDVRHAGLRALAEGLGGGFRLSAARVQVDLQGATAWVYPNDTRVTASLAEFVLAHPVVEQDGQAWLALRDVPVFFRQAFGIEVRAAASVTPELDAAPLEPLLDSELVLEDDGLLAHAPDEPLAAEELPAPDPLQEISADAIRELRAARGPERIVIDPSHGGDEAGVVGPSGVTEKDVTLAVAIALRDRLHGRIGREVLLTREDDRSVEVTQRAVLVTEPEKTLFISLHCGGAFAPGAAGVSVYYLPDIVDESMRQLGPVERQRALAQRTAHATASRQLGERVGRLLAERGATSLRGVRGVASRVLLAADTTGILVELGCLTTPSEEERLGTRAYQEVLAEALADAILVQYGLDSPGAAR